MSGAVDGFPDELIVRVHALGLERAREMIASFAFPATPIAEVLASAYVLGAVDTARSAAAMRIREQALADGPPDWFTAR